MSLFPARSMTSLREARTCAMCKRTRGRNKPISIEELKNMKSLVLSEYSHLELADFPVPQAGPLEVLVRVEAAHLWQRCARLRRLTGRRIPPSSWP